MSLLAEFEGEMYEEDLSTIQPSKETLSWFSEEDADKVRAESHQPPTEERKEEVICLNDEENTGIKEKR